MPGNDIFELFFDIVVDVLMILGVGELHLQPQWHRLAPWGLPGSILERFGGHFGAIGGPGVTLWGHIGALDGVFWGLFCAVYCRRVFGTKMLTELCQNGVPMHGIL